jgi:membrane associated rhomboid family serine protease
MEPIKAVILILLAAIVVSLGKAMFHLSGGGEPEDSAKMARALTFRIGLSIALFAVLMLAWYLKQFNPHGLQ